MRLRSFFSSALAKVRGFAPNTRANVAMMFGLSLVPMMVATGAGIDFARGVMVHQRMSEALDAAALAVGNATSKPSACSADGTSGSNNACYALRQTAQQYFDMNYDHSKDANYGTPGAVSIGISNQAVTLNASLPLKLTLLGISSINIGAPTVAASSTVVWGQTKLWVALVLDVSGSMSNGDSGGSKMDALQDAITNSSYGLLNILQNAAANAGDVKVGIVPFNRSINMGYSSFVNSGYIDWGEWEAPPPGVSLGSNLGPGDDCPFTDTSTDWRGRTTISTKSPYGFYCMPSSSNQSTNNAVSSIPSSGLICPSVDSGAYNSDHRDRYYNGCYSSDAHATTTTGSSTTKTICSNKSSCTTSNYCGGYPDTDTSTSGHTAIVTTTTCSCSGSGSNKSCKTVATPKTTVTTFTHVWTVNSHSTWSGCVMDRQQKNKQTSVQGGTGYRTAANKDYDETNTQPNSNTSSWDDTQFPAENNTACSSSTAPATVLNYDWTSLASKVNAMNPGGNTNQAIGVAHGWQMLTTGAPYGTGTLPAGTSKVLILFSDGLNTQDRWYGDGGTEGTVEDGYIDTRENATCTAAKAAGVTIYAIFLHIGSNGSSTALQNCATDNAKYYDLAASSQVKTAFADIAQKITNLRVSQ